MTESNPPPDQGWSDRPATTDPASPASGQWSQAPAPSSTAAVVVERPGRVTVASIILIILGVLTLLVGLLALLLGALVSGAAGDPNLQAQLPGVPVGAFGGFVIVFAIVLLAWGILEILSGAKALGGRNWARITGMVLAALGLVFQVLGMVATMGAPQTAETEAAAPINLVINVIIAVVYLFVIWAYATSGRWFASRAG